MSFNYKSGLIVFHFFLFVNCFSQSQVIDSLLKCIKTQKNIDSLSNTYSELCWEVSYYGQNKEAIEYGLKAVDLANQNNNQSNLILAQNALGSAYDEISEFKKAEYYFLKVVDYYRKNNSRKKLSKSLNNLGSVYFSESNYKKALECFYESLKIKEGLNDSVGIANCYTNMANVYWELDQKDKAIELFNKSIAIDRKTNNPEGLAASLSNIGGLYSFLGKPDKAYQCYTEALQTYQRINLPEGLASCYSNIAFYFRELHLPDSAVFYYEKSKQISEQVGDKLTVANTLVALGELKSEQNKPKEAINYYNEAIEILIPIKNYNSLKSAYLALSNAYYDAGDYKNSIIIHRQYTFIKDSLFNEENSKIFSDLKTQFEVDKKETELSAKAEAERDKLKKISEIDKQKRNSVIIAVIAILLILLIFSLLLFKRFKLIQKQNKIIELQKQEVEVQKHLIEEHQKEMNDSISYARRIQSSFMASESEFSGVLKEHFILFKPKDVVSGDFYWANHLNDTFYLCVADSTGHGIPGAFMSLLNISLLNEALLSRMLNSTKDILNFVRKILIIGLKPDESGQGGNDGMDCVMIALDLKKNTLEFSGANNPLWIIREGELIELKPDKMPVGRSPKQDISFESTKFDLQKGDVLYLFTDGYADQFGGEKGKKFKYKQLSDLFLSIYLLPLEEQKKVTAQRFEDWQGTLEQVDDVCIIGLRI